MPWIRLSSSFKPANAANAVADASRRCAGRVPVDDDSTTSGVASVVVDSRSQSGKQDRPMANAGTAVTSGTTVAYRPDGSGDDFPNSTYSSFQDSTAPAVRFGFDGGGTGKHERYHAHQRQQNSSHGLDSFKQGNIGRLCRHRSEH